MAIGTRRLERWTKRGSARRGAVPEPLLRRVVDAFDPEAVILFGSRARGDQHSASDWDLLVIVHDHTPEDRFDAEFCWYVQRKAVPGVHADIVPCKLSVFHQAKTVINTLSREAEREGLVVYERGSQDGRNALAGAR